MENPDKRRYMQKVKEALKMQMCYCGIRIRLVVESQAYLKFTILIPYYI
jgi:hypothetical protein